MCPTLPDIYRREKRENKENHRGIKINSILCDSLREISVKSRFIIGTGPAVPVFLNRPDF
jgi:hypothetical protein